MTYRDLYFATHHQAAHAVAAIALGCRVEFLDIGVADGEGAWNLDLASVDDIESICAVGFAIEKQLGRMPEQAWSRSGDDRALLGAMYADRTGLALDERNLADRFNNGADGAQAILNHQTARAAIDSLASALSALYGMGERRMSGRDVLEIVGPILGVENREVAIVA